MRLAATGFAVAILTVGAHGQDRRIESATTQSRAAFLCLAYGDGFVPVPGTDTCVRAGGDLEAGVLSSTISRGPLQHPGAGRGRDAIAQPGRGHGFTRSYRGAGIDFESHTPTDIGSIDMHVRVENWQFGR